MKIVQCIIATLHFAPTLAVIITTSEGTEHRFKKKKIPLLKKAPTLKEYIKDAESEKDCFINLPDISATTFKQILKYLKQTKQTKSSRWQLDKALSLKEFQRFILAAHFLNLNTTNQIMDRWIEKVFSKESLYNLAAHRDLLENIYFENEEIKQNILLRAQKKITDLSILNAPYAKKNFFVQSNRAHLSQNGQYLCAHTNNPYLKKIINHEGKKLYEISNIWQTHGCPIKWSPNGKKIIIPLAQKPKNKNPGPPGFDSYLFWKLVLQEEPPVECLVILEIETGAYHTALHFPDDIEISDPDRFHYSCNNDNLIALAHKNRVYLYDETQSQMLFETKAKNPENILADCSGQFLLYKTHSDPPPNNSDPLPKHIVIQDVVSGYARKILSTQDKHQCMNIVVDSKAEKICTIVFMDKKKTPWASIYTGDFNINSLLSELITLDIDEAGNHPYQGVSAAFLKTQQHLAIGTQAGNIYIYDLRDKNCINKLNNKNGPINALAATNLGQLVAQTTNSQLSVFEECLVVYDILPEELMALMEHDPTNEQLIFLAALFHKDAENKLDVRNSHLVSVIDQLNKPLQEYIARNFPIRLPKKKAMKLKMGYLATSFKKHLQQELIDMLKDSSSDSE